MVGWCSMGTFNDPCMDLLPWHCQDCSLLGGRDCDAGTAFLQTKSAYRWTSLGAETEMAPMAPSFFQMGEEVPTTSNNLLNPEQVWAISNWVRCCGCRKVAHKLLDFWKTRDPQKRSKKDVTSHASLDIPRMTSDFCRPHGHPHKESPFDPHRQVTSQVGVVHGASTASATSATVGEVHMDRTRQMRQWQDGCPSAVVFEQSWKPKKHSYNKVLSLGGKVWTLPPLIWGIKCVLHALCTGFLGYYIVGVHLSSPIIVWIFNGVIRYFAWVGV